MLGRSGKGLSSHEGGSCALFMQIEARVDMTQLQHELLRDPSNLDGILLFQWVRWPPVLRLGEIRCNTHQPKTTREVFSSVLSRYIKLPSLLMPSTTTLENPRESKRIITGIRDPGGASTARLFLYEKFPKVSLHVLASRCWRVPR